MWVEFNGSVHSPTTADRPIDIRRTPVFGVEKKVSLTNLIRYRLSIDLIDEDQADVFIEGLQNPQAYLGNYPDNRVFDAKYYLGNPTGDPAIRTDALRFVHGRICKQGLFFVNRSSGLVNGIAWRHPDNPSQRAVFTTPFRSYFAGDDDLMALIFFKRMAGKDRQVLSSPSSDPSPSVS